MTKSMQRIQVALSLPESVPALVIAVAAILQSIEGNAFFPAPSPSLAALGAALAELRDAEVATETKTRGTVAVRDEKRVALLSLLKRLKAYVQGVADDDPDHAAAIIESAGMKVWQATTGAKSPFEVKAGSGKGKVQLFVRAAAKDASYQWEWSADGGETWHPASPTLQATTTLEGLPSGVTCLFRYRAILRGGTSNWSEPVAFRVP